MAAKPRAVLIIGVIAVAIAAVASVLFYNYLKKQEEIAKEAVETRKVVVATRAIAVGSAIDSTQVSVVDWPAASVPPAAVTSIHDAVGRMAIQSVAVGDPVTEPKLVPRGGMPGVLTYKIPKGHRAMTVGVDQVSGVAGFIMPGNMVDVVLTTTPPGTQNPISKIILQNIPVLATGQVIEKEKEGKPVIVPTVTLDLLPGDAEKLALASNQGRLQLLLRRAGDEGLDSATGTTISRVMSGGYVAAGRPGVKRTPSGAVGYRTVSVEVLRDSKKSIETFNVKAEAAK